MEKRKKFLNFRNFFEKYNFFRVVVSHIKSNMVITSSGKSGVVRIEVPPVHRLEEIAHQKKDIMAGLSAAKELLNWFYEISEEKQVCLI